MRRLGVPLALAFLTAACGGDGNGDSVGTTATTTSVPASTPARSTASSATTTAVATTTAETTSTTISETPPEPVPGDGEAAFAITQVVFGEAPYVAIRNTGSGAGTTDGLWLCQFPAYWPLPAARLEPGQTLAVALGDAPVPDLIGVAATAGAEGTLGTVAVAGGELGLYSASTFSDPAAIIDYVEWGTGGHERSGVAVAAGIWVEDGYVAVAPETLGLVAGSFPTSGPDAWVAEVGG